jgi:excinuclease ABC subunit B
MSQRFELVSDFRPMGDQPQAIEGLVEGLKQDRRYQTLLGATGTGKTYTIAEVFSARKSPRW